MNKFRKIVFGVVGLLAFAYGIVWIAGLKGLGIIVVLAFIGALLLLTITWKLIITIIQLTSNTLAAVGHLIGIVGDEITDWCKGRKAWLDSLGTTSVPDWDNVELAHAGSTETPDAPSFVSSAMERQNV